MLLEEKDHAVFKSWLLPKLENISDAEAGVLADYVAALVTVDDTDTNVQRTLIESLEDFLGRENTEPFAKDMIAGLKAKSYLPEPKANDGKPQLPVQASQSAPIQSIVGSTNFEYEPHPSNVPSGAPRGPAATRTSTAPHHLPDRPTAQGIYQDGSNQSRKRKVLERGDSQLQEGQDPHYNRSGGGNNRPPKQTARRGGRNAGAGDVRFQNAFGGFGGMPNFTNLPPPPPGPLPFDPSDPMAFFAMAAAFGANLPGMPQLPFPNGQDSGSNQGRSKTTKCTDYYERGFCALGNFCPHEHSDAAVTVSPDEIPEYDPEQSFLAVQPHGASSKQAASGSQLRKTKGRRLRSSFSLPGYSHDRSNTTLVVEQIPQQHFNEDSVRGYFSEFGDISSLELHPKRRLAVIKFANRQAANQAFNSPKAVFENRFVKVYWYGLDTGEKLSHEKDEDVDMEDPKRKEEEKLDLEAIAIRQVEAQKAFEERRRKAEEADARAAEIERQLEEKNKEIAEIKRQLAELSGDPSDEFSQTLATLQAEAAELFDQHGPDEPSPSGRGRGAYRGRSYAPFAPRGKGYTPYRGAYRGRASGFVGRAVNKKLDNRPRRLAVMGTKPDTPRDESLRQHLFNIPECSIERHPEQAETLILTFKERYQAEDFLNQSLNIPDVGKLDLAWVPNDAFGGLGSVTTTTTDASAANIDNDDDSSAIIGEQEIKVEEEDDNDDDEGHQTGGVDADMDVADDVDEWL